MLNVSPLAERDFRLLFVLQSHKLVVHFDDCQWFHEDRGATGRSAVNNAVHGPFLLRSDRNDKTPVTNRHELLLQL